MQLKDDKTDRNLQKTIYRSTTKRDLKIESIHMRFRVFHVSADMKFVARNQT